MKPTGNIFSRLEAIYRNRQEPEALKMLARVYWHAMLGVAFVLVVIAIVYGGYVLMTVFSDNGASAVTVPTKAPVNALTEEKITEVISGFEARQLRFDALKTSTITVPDPSK